MQSPNDRSWVAHAVHIIEADFNRSSDTHLLRVPLPGVRGVALYLKDESTHPTGSLKHRLTRSLFLYGLCNGWIGPQTTIVEASSGSTAVSEAYFGGSARPTLHRRHATRHVNREDRADCLPGGETHFVDNAAAMYAESASLAAELGGGNLLLLLRAYVAARGTTHAAALAPFMPRVEATDLMLDTHMEFRRGR